MTCENQDVKLSWVERIMWPAIIIFSLTIWALAIVGTDHLVNCK